MKAEKEFMKNESQLVSVIKQPDGSTRVRVRTINSEPTMAQQQFKDECDINKIMDKYQKTGEFTHLTSKQGRYADFSSIQDYREMLDTVRYADEAFMKLPATIRSRFGNDPQQLLDFVQDNKNYDEGVKLGLVQPKPKPKTAGNNDDSNDDNTQPKTKTKTSEPKS